MHISMGTEVNPAHEHPLLAMTPPSLAPTSPTPPHWTTLPGAPAPGALVGLLSDFADDRATMAQLDTGSGTGSTVPFKLLVLREGNSVRAFVNRCAHFGVPLAAQPSQLIQVPLRSITCNVHYARYAWSDGRCESVECAGESLIPIPVQVDANGMVCVAA